MSDGNRNGWNVYKKLVLSEIERLDGRVDDLYETVNDLNIGQAKINVKLALISTGAAAATSAIVSVLMEMVLS